MNSHGVIIALLKRVKSKGKKADLKVIKRHLRIYWKLRLNNYSLIKRCKRINLDYD